MLVGQPQVTFFHFSVGWGWMLQTPCWHFSNQTMSWKEFQVMECLRVLIKSQRPLVIWCTHRDCRCIIINTISMRCVLTCIYKHRQTLWMESLESLLHYSNIMRQMLEMVGGKSFPCHPMWFQCFLFRWCKFLAHLCPWTCFTSELIPFCGCRKKKKSQRDWSNNVWQKRLMPKGLQMRQQGERKQGFERRLKKRSLKK
jgi:hypothetical protein